MLDLSDVVFVDCETTGLDPENHEIWEVGLICPGADVEEWSWQLPVDLGRADLVALKIGKFHDRYLHKSTNPRRFSTDFERLTRGKHLVGAVVSFDEQRLRRLMTRNGACPSWHYHIIDVEALAVGYIRGLVVAGIASPEQIEVVNSLPWKSDHLTEVLGVEPVSEEERHTALGDARWARRIYEKVQKNA